MAAQNYIPLPAGTPLAGKIAQYVAVLRNAVEIGNELKETMAQAAADGTAVFTANMAFPSDTQGQENAAAVRSVISSAATDIAASGAVAQAISRFL